MIVMAHLRFTRISVAKIKFKDRDGRTSSRRVVEVDVPCIVPVSWIHKIAVCDVHQLTCDLSQNLDGDRQSVISYKNRDWRLDTFQDIRRPVASLKVINEGTCKEVFAFCKTRILLYIEQRLICPPRYRADVARLGKRCIQALFGRYWPLQ